MASSCGNIVAWPTWRRLRDRPVFAVTFEQDTVQLRPEAGFHSDLENPAGPPQDATDRDGET